MGRSFHLPLPSVSVWWMSTPPAWIVVHGFDLHPSFSTIIFLCNKTEGMNISSPKFPWLLTEMVNPLSQDMHWTGLGYASPVNIILSTNQLTFTLTKNLENIYYLSTNMACQTYRMDYKLFHLVYAIAMISGWLAGLWAILVHSSGIIEAISSHAENDIIPPLLTQSTAQLRPLSQSGIPAPITFLFYHGPISDCFAYPLVQWNLNSKYFQCKNRRKSHVGSHIYSLRGMLMDLSAPKVPIRRMGHGCKLMHISTATPRSQCWIVVGQYNKSENPVLCKYIDITCSLSWRDSGDANTQITYLIIHTLTPTCWNTGSLHDMRDECWWFVDNISMFLRHFPCLVPCSCWEKYVNISCWYHLDWLNCSLHILLLATYCYCCFQQHTINTIPYWQNFSYLVVWTCCLMNTRITPLGPTLTHPWHFFLLHVSVVFIHMVKTNLHTLARQPICYRM